MKPFRFQKFTINQNADVFRVGTDGVLLGAMVSCKNSLKILEIGTGTGLISLMLAQRNLESTILAIDIDENAIHLAEENFRNSIFSERLKAGHQDFKNFVSEEKYDLLVCNPPFYEENSSEKDILARQQVSLNFNELIENASKNLSEEGIFAVIIPAESAENFIKICSTHQLHLNRKINVFGIENGVLKRNILEFSFSQKTSVEQNFTIEKGPRKYSEQYLELTAAFHVFKK